MLIRDVRATWLRCPIPVDQQHVSDFGRISSFDTTIVRIEVDDGLVGWGEAKAGVGSSGSCRAVVATVRDELGPALVGQDARRLTAAWDTMYNGPRAGYAFDRGRGFPVLGRRGLTVSAMSGIDMALWDLLGKSLDVPVVDLWGGPRTDTLPAYASGGWADAAGIGEQLLGYVAQGFGSVKMRVGVMDGDVDTSVERVHAARQALGPGVGLMVDAHGTYSAPEAMRFAAGVADLGLRWFEEPVNADDHAGARRVRASTDIPIAAGESEFTRFDFRDLIERETVDVLQPDLAICGGPSEGRRIAALPRPISSSWLRTVGARRCRSTPASASPSPVPRRVPSSTRSVGTRCCGRCRNGHHRWSTGWSPRRPSPASGSHPGPTFSKSTR